MSTPTPRANAVCYRTYHRPISPEDQRLETWDQVVDRVINHQEWLWRRALSKINKKLTEENKEELEELRNLILLRKIAPAGRTLWLGGTKISRTNEVSMFNCAGLKVVTIYDIVDLMWLLLNGAGIGFKPIVGSLNGFRKPLNEIQVIRSNRKSPGGMEKNEEFWDPETKIWRIKVGDSAQAWAKAVGKLVAGKYPAKKLILDFSEIRPAGIRLKGYGWISGGDEQISIAFKKIAQILSDRADQLLSAIDILDICNHLGTTLSSRRSAQMALYSYDGPEWLEFAEAKKDYWLNNKEHRRQSNNSLVFYRRPTKKQLKNLFDIIEECGGSDPGLTNMKEAQKRAPWCSTLNPCGEALLGNKSFCNLCTINLPAFKHDKTGLDRALYIAGRMNYRQTLVDLNDGILQEAWHTNNTFLHLCGVDLTGIATTNLTAYDYKRMKNIAVSSAYGMANELDTPLPKNVTVTKPSGTISKVFSCEEWGEVPEGIHKPLGKYIFNWITFARTDPLVKKFTEANYKIIEKPTEPESVLICFPIKYSNIEFDKVFKDIKNPKTRELEKKLIEVNLESAITQLNRYKLVMNSWCEQNVSVTISYDTTEVDEIIDWLYNNWDNYVGVSFIYRQDPTKTAEDLGHPYLPQEVVTEEKYNEYVQQLKKVDYSELIYHDIEHEECSTGACPIR